MNGTAHAGLGYLALMVVLAVLVIRYAVTGGTPAKHRAPRRRVEEFVPGHHLIPALAHGAVVPTAVAYCRGCRTQVPVTIHGDATRCDQGHVTIHTAGGAL